MKLEPTFILTGDWHVRETTPVCRTDNFVEETQWKKIRFICELQQKYKCPILHSGDFFDNWKPSVALVSKTTSVLKEFKYPLYCIYGNHDLPQHSISLEEKCGLYNLYLNNLVEGALEGVEVCSWKETPQNAADILVWHVFTYKGEPPWPGCPAMTAKQILKKYPQYELIVTGDNHKTFVEEYQRRLLVNPGSIFRMDADQIDHKPCVFLYYAETNKVEPVYLPIEEGVVSREHLEIQRERDNRIDSFIAKLNTEFGIEISFEKNLEKFFQNNKVGRSVKEIILKSLEE